MLTKDAIKEYHSNGQLEWFIPIEWHVVGAYRKHGESICYYPTGEVKIRQTYEHGKLVGQETMYFRDGSIMAVTHFNDGKIDGTHTRYHQDGSVEECEYAGGLQVDGSISRKDKDGNEVKRPRAPEPKTILPGDHIPPSIAR